MGSFREDKNKVTIWRKSAGQVLMSYGGRHDNLSHHSIQESGSAATAWYNSTTHY